MVVIILNLKIRDKSCDFNFIIKKNNNNNHKSLVLYNYFTMFDHKSHLMTKPNTEGFQDLRFFKKEKLQMELHLLHVSTESLFASYYFLFKKSLKDSLVLFLFSFLSTFSFSHELMYNGTGMGCHWTIPELFYLLL